MFEYTIAVKSECKCTLWDLKRWHFGLALRGFRFSSFYKTMFEYTIAVKPECECTLWEFLLFIIVCSIWTLLLILSTPLSYPFSCLFYLKILLILSLPILSNHILSNLILCYLWKPFWTSIDRIQIESTIGLRSRWTQLEHNIAD